MKVLATTIAVLIAAAAGLTLYLPDLDAASQEPPAFKVDAASAAKPVRFATFSMSERYVDSAIKSDIGLLLALVSTTEDAQREAQRWQQLLSGRHLPSQPLILFTLTSSEHQKSYALVMGPVADEEMMSSYQSAAAGEMFANQLVQWPIAKEKTP